MSSRDLDHAYCLRHEVYKNESQASRAVGDTSSVDTLLRWRDAEPTTCSWCLAATPHATIVDSTTYHWHCLKRRLEMLRWHADLVQQNARETRALTERVSSELRRFARA